MIKDRILQIRDYLKGLSNNQEVLKSLDYYTFYISLLPIPGVQQSGQIANKIINSRDLNLKFKSINEDLVKVNKKIEATDDELERMQMIANTVDNVSSIEERVKEFLDELRKEFSEFILETEEHSTQTLIKQIINADFASISAVDNSHNVIKDTRLNTKTTHLKARNYSSNYIDGTEFGDGKGSVGMNGIRQQGDIGVTGSAVIFGSDGTIYFGRSPEKYAINPNCNTQIEAHPRE